MWTFHILEQPIDTKSFVAKTVADYLKLAEADEKKAAEDKKQREEEALKRKIKKELKEKAIQLLAKAEKYQKESEKYSQKLMKDAQDEAQKYAEESKQMVEVEIAKKTAAALNRIQIEEASAIREIKSKIVTLAIANLSQNISKELTSANHEQLFAQAMQDLEKTV
jgi:F0F1-type ATP synthase membrane subunit b/b'